VGNYLKGDNGQQRNDVHDYSAVYKRGRKRLRSPARFSPPSDLEHDNLGMPIKRARVERRIRCSEAVQQGMLSHSLRLKNDSGAVVISHSVKRSKDANLASWSGA
jgi:hypothetical protein